MLTRDIELSGDEPKTFLLQQHKSYLKHYHSGKELSYEQVMVEYLKMSGIYWTTTALQLIQSDFNDGKN